MKEQFPLEAINQRIRKIVSERDWDRFHTPKNLAMALAGEAGELLEVFQWLTAEESMQVMEKEKNASAVKHEIADILVYLIRLADKLEIDLEAALQEKLTLNEKKYPVHLSKGSATKYTEF